MAMDAGSFNSSLTICRLTHAAASELFGVETRSIRRWASGSSPVPEAVAIVLRLLRLRYNGITLDDIEYIAGRITAEERDARRDLRAAQRRLNEIEGKRLEKMINEESERIVAAGINKSAQKVQAS
jgi:hypothetical protein